MTHSRCADGDTTDRYEWDSLTHPWVRDLAWLLHAPDLVATAYAGRPTLAELGLENSACRQAWLRELDMAPERLEPYLGECPRRLGLYHERLWHALLDLAPATRLLATNLVLHAHGRTLGELDLLYVDAQGRPVHLELAIKYYLGLRDGPGDTRDPARWIGTGCADSLARKLHHTLRHQLPLAHHPASLTALKANGIDPTSLEQRIAMPGVLFRPWPHSLPAPRPSRRTALQGVWLPWRDWPALHGALPDDSLGVTLHKPHWLAPPRDERYRPLPVLEAELREHFVVAPTPRQCHLTTPDGTQWRVFVVPDDWPRSLPLPPTTQRRRSHAENWGIGQA
ncbi:DUF1853 family protein [Chromohalobacter sp.]|uniref:DUF1853 family protein n=1 Tax=Chromohalobacter sp. TaxID=50740 RepID=UPI001DFB1125|nr:DUF1853 family protein [Chromohalobacter sp.]NQY44690.1 DUF1853 family protein [Chromohalobacter sp.]